MTMGGRRRRQVGRVGSGGREYAGGWRCTLPPAARPDEWEQPGL